MTRLKVLIDTAGAVLGTVREDGASGEGDGPVKGAFVAGPGQRIVTVDVDDDIVEGPPATLYSHIRNTHIG
ncbi:hypothetical protein ACIPSE_29320 [Streptomyces sp. NPDC090106]|uniref:hypothetical protein n=1 Tax=Streptomyces sp. NPDC090106 TaxID=3365946 RepID=UPI00380BB313